MKKAQLLEVESKSSSRIDQLLVDAFNKWTENPNVIVTMILEPRRWSIYPHGDTTYYGSLIFFYDWFE